MTVTSLLGPSACRRILQVVSPEPEPPPTESAYRASDEKTDKWHAHEHCENCIDHGVEAEFAGVHDAILSRVATLKAITCAPDTG